MGVGHQVESALVELDLVGLDPGVRRGVRLAARPVVKSDDSSSADRVFDLLDQRAVGGVVDRRLNGGAPRLAALVGAPLALGELAGQLLQQRAHLGRLGVAVAEGVADERQDAHARLVEDRGAAAQAIDRRASAADCDDDP